MTEHGDFAERLAAATPTPGGGAAAARTGRHATSLLRMVTSITLSKEAPRGFRERPEGKRETLEALREVEDRAVELGKEFSRLEEADIRAFEGYLAALRLPSTTPDESSLRSRSLREAAIGATEVPLATLDASLETLGLARLLIDLGARAKLRAESDVGGAVELAHAAFRAAELNVRVNLPSLGDARREYEKRFESRLSRLEREYPRLRREILARLAR